MIISDMATARLARMVFDHSITMNDLPKVIAGIVIVSDDSYHQMATNNHLKVVELPKLIAHIAMSDARAVWDTDPSKKTERGWYADGMEVYANTIVDRTISSGMAQTAKNYIKRIASYYYDKSRKPIIPGEARAACIAASQTFTMETPRREAMLSLMAAGVSSNMANTYIQHWRLKLKAGKSCAMQSLAAPKIPD